MADDWESMMEAGVTNEVDPTKFKGEEDNNVVSLEKPEEKKIESQPKNPEKVIYPSNSNLNQEAKKKKAEEINKKWDEKNGVSQDSGKRGPLTAEELRRSEE